MRPPAPIAAALSALTFATCGYNDPIPDTPPPPEPGTGSVGVLARAGVAVDYPTARRAHSRYSDDLTDAFPAVAGHGVGQDGGIKNPERNDDAYVITVFLASSGGVPDADYSVDGVKIRFEVTGPFKALPAL